MPAAEKKAKRARVGVCRQCGCTDQRACAQGCGWIAPSLCSACHAENTIVDAIRARPRFQLTLGEFFAAVMPDGSWDEIGDVELAALIAGEADGLRRAGGPMSSPATPADGRSAPGAGSPAAATRRPAARAGSR